MGAERATRGRRFGGVGHLWHTVGWLLGERRRWVLALPVVAVLGALADVAVLFGIMQSLLLLLREESTMRIERVDLVVSIDDLLLLAAAASAASIAIRIVESMLLGRLSGKAAYTSRQRVIAAFLGADWQVTTQQRAGRFQQLLGTNSFVAATAVGHLGNILSSLVNLVAYGVAITVVSPLVASLFLVLGLIAVGGMSLARRSMRTAAAHSTEASADVQLASTTLGMLHRELQVFGARSAAQRELAVLNRQATVHFQRLKTWQRIIPSLFQQAVLLVVIVAIVFTERVDIDPASFGAAGLLAVRSLGFLQRFNTSTQAYVEAQPYVEELLDAIQEQSAGTPARGDAELGPVGSLVLEEVSFAYGDVVALHDVDLRLGAGERVGIVGPSGSGKTTLANLLVGLLQPSSGRYLVDGRPATDYRAASWADRFALVSQDPLLIRGTVAENIAFFRDASRREVEDAARKAAVHADIERLPDGYETRVGDGEGSLSGGQRQRVALARAVLHRPAVLVLDEPTSALDAPNARSVELALGELDAGTTVIVISHRASLLRRCDRFLLLDGGRIVADGDRHDARVATHVVDDLGADEVGSGASPRI